MESFGNARQVRHADFDAGKGCNTINGHGISVLATGESDDQDRPEMSAAATTARLLAESVMTWVTRRRFLAASGGVLGLSAAGAPVTEPASASTTHTMDRSFTGQSRISNSIGAVQLSQGVKPATGYIWELRRVFWNVNFYGVVADGVQTYLYRLPSSYTTAQAMAHMASSLEGWLGCCGNSGLTGNGDMSFNTNEVLVRPGQFLWIYFITSAASNGFYTAAGMSVWEARHQA